MATKKTVKKTTKAPVKKTASHGAELGAAALAAAATAGAAGYYFYGTAHAKRHRQAASKWAKDMKRDVLKSAKSLQKIDAKTIARVVDDAAAAYQGMRGVAKDDVRVAAHELKRNWNKVHAELMPSSAVKKTVRTAVRTVEKAAKKAAPKKAVKKTSKKR